MPKHDHPPYFQFYVDDFISDSAVDAMSNDGLGIYVRLLCKAWKETPVGTIPNDDAVLASWGKCTPSQWAKRRIEVLRAFSIGDDERYHQKRMEVEWSKLIAAIESKSEAGRKAAGKRWHSQRNAVALPTQCHSDSDSDSDSPDVDVDGARCITSEDISNIRAKANRIWDAAKGWKGDDRNLVAKVAVLWHSGELSEDDAEQAIESFERKQGIRNPGAWLHRCLANRCEQSGLNFESLLAAVSIPAGLHAKATVA